MGMLTPRRKQWLLHGYLHPSHECPGAEYVKPGPGNVPGPGTRRFLTVCWRPPSGCAAVQLASGDAHREADIHAAHAGHVVISRRGLQRRVVVRADQVAVATDRA